MDNLSFSKEPSTRSITQDYPNQYLEKDESGPSNPTRCCSWKGFWRPCLTIVAGVGLIALATIDVALIAFVGFISAGAALVLGAPVTIAAGNVAIGLYAAGGTLIGLGITDLMLGCCRSGSDGSGTQSSQGQDRTSIETTDPTVERLADSGFSKETGSNKQTASLPQTQSDDNLPRSESALDFEERGRSANSGTSTPSAFIASQPFQVPPPFLSEANKSMKGLESN